MTVDTITLPRDTWEQLLNETAPEYEPEPDYTEDDALRPAMHRYTPYNGYDRDSICGDSGCGASPLNPVHFV